jgi:hypothetical protein
MSSYSCFICLGGLITVLTAHPFADKPARVGKTHPQEQIHSGLKPKT